jgi:hypothetical protein
LLALVLAAGTAVAGGGATKTAFTGNGHMVALIAPGTESFPDGRYHVRGGQQLFAMTADDPRLNNAEILIFVNWNFATVPPPVVYTGRIWGEFTITNEGGYWKGTWTGTRDERGFSYYQLIGAGSGGYEGQQLRFWGQRENPDPTVQETYYGIIIEPGR